MIFFSKQKKCDLISFEDDRYKEIGRQINHTYILIFTEVYTYFLSIKCKFTVGDGNAT